MPHHLTDAVPLDFIAFSYDEIISEGLLLANEQQLYIATTNETRREKITTYESALGHPQWDMHDWTLVCILRHTIRIAVCQSYSQVIYSICWVYLRRSAK